MRRTLCLLLCTLLLLSACSPAQSNPEPQNIPSADQIAQAVLAACGQDSGQLQTLEEALDGGDLDAYVSDFYGLPAGSWDDCAVYLSTSPVSAFEVAVFRLTGQADPTEVEAGLETYRLGRQGDFTGYNPEQAALVEGGVVLLSNNESYAALLICEQVDAAQDAFFTALEQPSTSPSPSPSVTPSPGGSPAIEPATTAPATTAPITSTPTSEPSPAGADPSAWAGRIPYTDPGVDDMSIYDTSAILAAWRSGDLSALSDYDRAIYQRAAEVLGQLLTDSMSDSDKELAIYGWLVSNVSYDYDHYSLFTQVSRDSYTPYNPLMEGKGVCLGFATTFQLLMDLAGVECITVVGASFDSREDHAWNMVRLDGTWYCVDATWDTGMPRQFWRYFNVSSDYMAQTDHQWDYPNTPEAP